MSKTIVLGDDIGIVATLKVRENGVVTNANFASATSVKLALLHGSTTVLSATLTDGATYTDKKGTLHTADWSTGKIVATFTSAQTRTLTANTQLHIEVTVDKSGITTWPRGTFEGFIVKQDFIDTA